MVNSIFVKTARLALNNQWFVNKRGTVKILVCASILLAGLMGKCVTAQNLAVSEAWHDWFPIGSTPGFSVGNTVAAVARKPDQIDLFTVGTDGHVYSTWWNPGDGWDNNHDWFPIGDMIFPVAGVVTAIAQKQEQIDLFIVGEDGRVYSTWWNPEDRWDSNHDWFPIGNKRFPRLAQVTAIARKPDQLDIFVIDEAGYIYSTWWNPKDGWDRNHDWLPVGSATFYPYGTKITAIARKPDQIDLFAVGTDGYVYSTWWNPRDGWDRNHDWFPIGNGPYFSIGTVVAAVARKRDQIDLFAVGADGHVYSTWWNPGDGWDRNHDWFIIGNGTDFSFGNTVTAVTRNPNQIDLFAIANDDGHLYTTWWNPAYGWYKNHNWTRIGGTEDDDVFPLLSGSTVSAIARKSNQIDLFLPGRDGNIYSSWWTQEKTGQTCSVVIGGSGESRKLEGPGRYTRFGQWSFIRKTEGPCYFRVWNGSNFTGRVAVYGTDISKRIRAGARGRDDSDGWRIRSVEIVRAGSEDCFVDIGDGDATMRFYGPDRIDNITGWNFLRRTSGHCSFRVFNKSGFSGRSMLYGTNIDGVSSHRTGAVGGGNVKGEGWRTRSLEIKRFGEQGCSVTLRSPPLEHTFVGPGRYEDIAGGDTFYRRFGDCVAEVSIWGWGGFKRQYRELGGLEKCEPYWDWSQSAPNHVYSMILRRADPLDCKEEPKEDPENDGMPEPEPEPEPEKGGEWWHILCDCIDPYYTARIRIRACLQNSGGFGLACGQLAHSVGGGTTCDPLNWERIEGAEQCDPVWRNWKVDND